MIRHRIGREDGGVVVIRGDIHSRYYGSSTPDYNKLVKLCMILYVVVVVVVTTTTTSSKTMTSSILVQVQAFQFLKTKKVIIPTKQNVMPLSEDKISRDKTKHTKGSSGSSSSSSGNTQRIQPPVPTVPLLLLDFNASGSIGSLLLQMQRKEEEMRKLNKTLLDKDQAVELDPINGTSSSAVNPTTTDESSLSSSPFSIMDANNSTWVPKDNGNRQDDLLRWMRSQSFMGERWDSDNNNNNIVDDDDPNEGFTGGMIGEKAKELDEAVSVRLTSSVKDITVLDLPELYQSLTTTLPPTTSSLLEETTAIQNGDTVETVRKKLSDEEEQLPQLSRPEHYDGQIGRDMRHLAVAIASCIDDVAEWRLFCQQSTGGLMPLVQCIRDGAMSVREGMEVAPSASDYLVPNIGSGSSNDVSRKEESFLVASAACRALRDLCALSQDLAVVITDGLLRANVGFEKTGDYSLMDDISTLLRYADEMADVVPKSRKRELLSIRRRRRQQLQEQPEMVQPTPKSSMPPIWPLSFSRARKEARMKCKLYATQLLLAMACTSDSAVDAIRSTEGLQEVLLDISSYARRERRRRWIRYPGEIWKDFWLSRRKNLGTSKSKSTRGRRRRPFIQAASPTNDLNGRIQSKANQVLAAIGYNEWVPKIPGQKGLRILCLDGGGSRGMTAVMACKNMVDSLNGLEIADGFDLVVGTSTGAIIAFLVGLNRETSDQAVSRYDVLIEKIFTKSAFSTPMLLFTTASYDESPYMNVLSGILGDNTMLDSRADPAVPYVFAVTSKMSSTPTHVTLLRNYNYNGNELPDPFMIDPDDARERLGLFVENEADEIRMYNYPKKKEVPTDGPGRRKLSDGSRHPGSFRVLQRYALRASTAAPTVFKPVMMGGEMYCDGGIVASNPSAIAIHEARNLFPNVPIELVVSIGTGGFLEQKSEPRIGWDGIIGQIVNSATDGEQIHHILEDILGDGGTAQLGRSSVSNTRYMRFNPTLGLPDEFPIDVTDPEKLQKIKRITTEYMQAPEQQRKLQELADLLKGRSGGFRKWIRR